MENYIFYIKIKTKQDKTLTIPMQFKLSHGFKNGHMLQMKNLILFYCRHTIYGCYKK